MKKYILSLALPLIALSLAVVFILPTTTNAAPEVVCPAGNTCTPLVNACPAGLICVAGPQIVGCPTGFICQVNVPSVNVGVVGGGGSGTACYTFTRNLQVGSTGAEVVALQTFLISGGFSIPQIEDGSVPKGVFGPSTKVALVRYQASIGIPATGFLGPITRTRINASCGTVIPGQVPSITVVNPSNVTWAIGTTQQITWKSNISSDSEIYISLVREDGSGYYDVSSVYNRARNTGSYTWEVGKIPEGYTIDKTGRYWIRICKVDRSVCSNATTGGVVNIVPANEEIFVHDASSQVTSSNLTLNYLNQSENLLGATYTVNISAGSRDLNVYKNIAGHSFIDQNSVEASVSNSGVAFTPVNSLQADSFTDAKGSILYRVSAGKTVTFTATASIDPKKLFAGEYHGRLRYVAAYIIPEGSSLPKHFELPVPSNKTNTKVIIGEVSPYISSASYGNGSVVINGQRLSNVIIYVDGVERDPASVRRGVGGTVLIFSIPLSDGQHYIQVKDNTGANTGSSNTAYFQVGSVTTPVACPVGHICTPNAGTPRIGDCPENFTCRLIDSASASVTALLVGADSDKVGSSFGPGVGISNKNANDWHWRASVSTSKINVAIKSISIKSNSYGEGWSTSDDTSLLGKVMYPIAVYVNGNSLNATYNNIITDDINGMTLDLYGQPESVPFTGGTIIVKFGDGTTVTGNVAASNIRQDVPPTVDNNTNSSIPVLTATSPLNFNVLIDPTLQSTSNAIFRVQVSGTASQYRYYWNFGDGNTSNGTVLQGTFDTMGHRYVNPGTYYVNVWAIDTNNMQSNRETFTVRATQITQAAPTINVTTASKNTYTATVGADRQAFGTFNTNVTGEPVQVNKANFFYTSLPYCPGAIQNAYIIDESGVAIAGPVNAVNSEVSFTGNITFPVGAHAYKLQGTVVTCANGTVLTFGGVPYQWGGARGQATGTAVDMTKLSGFAMSTVNVSAPAAVTANAEYSLTASIWDAIKQYCLENPKDFACRL